MKCLHRSARPGVLVVTVCVVTLLWQACGGGGSSGSGGSDNGGGNGNNTPGTQATATRTPTRSSGSPAPTQPGQTGTPTPVPTGAPTLSPDAIFVFPGESIADAARSAPDGGVVVVAPGAYSAVVLDPGDLQGSVTLLADVTGEFTDSPQAPVTIVARSTDEAAFEAFSQTGLTLDSFILRGGTDAGILFADSSGITVRNCTVSNSGGDGVHFERSDNVLVFNTLITNNKGGGVTGFGTTNLQAINNTIYNNADDGIFLSVDENENPSTNAFLRNNIFNKNTPTGISVDPGPPSSLDGFDSDFNLNTNGYDGTDAGADDVAADPLFIFPTGGDFHVAAASRAVDRGSGDIDSDLVTALQARSTQTDGSLDTLPLDLGYHYPAPILTPTHAPRATSTNTPRVTATRTGGATATHTVPVTRTTTTPTPTPPPGKPTRTPTPTRTPRA
jgi:parallel beta-helix repeat protein